MIHESGADYWSENVCLFLRLARRCFFGRHMNLLCVQYLFSQFIQRNFDLCLSHWVFKQIYTFSSVQFICVVLDWQNCGTFFVETVVSWERKNNPVQQKYHSKILLQFIQCDSTTNGEDLAILNLSICDLYPISSMDPSENFVGTLNFYLLNFYPNNNLSRLKNQLLCGPKGEQNSLKISINFLMPS